MTGTVGRGKIFFELGPKQADGERYYVPTSVNEVGEEEEEEATAPTTALGGKLLKIWSFDASGTDTATGTPATLEQVDEDAETLELDWGATTELQLFVIQPGQDGVATLTFDTAQSAGSAAEAGAEAQRSSSGEASSKEEEGGLKATQRLLAEEGGEIEYRMMHQDTGLDSDNRASLRGTQQALEEEGDRQEQEMMAAVTGGKQH